MKMDRAYINYDEGMTCCCWDTPSIADLKQLFIQAEVPFKSMIIVEEMTTA